MKDKKPVNIMSQVAVASKWSAITQVMIKIITPLVSVILARILTPGDYGVVAIATMIVSFTEVFTDAGFKKFVIQYEGANNKQELSKIATVAFWSNLVLALFSYVIIFLSAPYLAVSLGNAQATNVIRLLSLGIIVHAFSGIQTALLQRELKFKTIFKVRFVATIVPAFASIPLAVLGWGYWALAIGTLAGYIANAITLWVLSQWRPSWHYNFQQFKSMFSFSAWSIAESFTIWLTTWVSAMIIGNALSSVELGMYQTSQSIVNMLTDLLSSPLTPVMFASLSRLQTDLDAFSNLFYKSQKMLSFVLLPAGLGIFLFGNTIQKIALGDKWVGTGDIISIWGITSCIMGVFNIAGNVIRAKGKPQISVLLQVIHLSFLIPTCLISVKYGFMTLVISRSIIRFQHVISFIIALKIMIGYSLKNYILSIKWVLFACSLMIFMYYIVNALIIQEGVFYDLVKMSICAVTYFLALFAERGLLVRTAKVVISKS